MIVPGTSSIERCVSIEHVIMSEHFYLSCITPHGMTLQLWQVWNKYKIYGLGLVWFMVFNATFNIISVISWRSVLLVEEI